MEKAESSKKKQETWVPEGLEPVWPGPADEQNQFLAFRADVPAGPYRARKILLACRTYYRLFVNGEMLANGPARTAKGYARVDEIPLPDSDAMLQLAVEVFHEVKTPAYSNDNTLDPGFFAACVTGEDEQGNTVVLKSTKNGDFPAKELSFREMKTEYMSHCRGLAELYRMDADSTAYRTDSFENWEIPEPVRFSLKFLKRRAPYPTYRPIPVEKLRKVRDVVPGEGGGKDQSQKIARFFFRQWYGQLEKRNCFAQELSCEREAPFTGRYTETVGADGSVRYFLKEAARPAAFEFSREKSEVGFLSVWVKVSEAAVVDMIHSDHLDASGNLSGNSYSVRYFLERGEYRLITAEPKLARFVKLVFRTAGTVEFTAPCVLDDTYPDTGRTDFSCSDGELNLLYEAARRTLRLNTLDIFMDCPERERGGWLCDSEFTADAAWTLFGDLSVEEDFIENFMLTDPEDYTGAFFPEVYPGSSLRPKACGIQSWSFWLVQELCDYAQRSGNRDFLNACFPRVEAFMDNVAAHVGEGGLFEGFDSLFVDWSLANRSEALYPVSLPNNCLLASCFERLGRLYGVERWTETGRKVRERIEALVTEDDETISDGLSWNPDSSANPLMPSRGGYTENGLCTEAGLALEMWSGFFRDKRKFTDHFVDAIGPCPKQMPSPYIAKSNLFIGLMIRFEALARLGEFGELVKEMEAVYLPQIVNGSGTLFENIQETSGCHGFNGEAGALLVKHVLGLQLSSPARKTVTICPHLLNLTWAQGSAVCGDGRVELAWKADHRGKTLEFLLSVPDGWEVVWKLPEETRGWTVTVNGK